MKAAIIFAAAFGVGIFTGAIVTAKSLELASTPAPKPIASVNASIPKLPPLPSFTRLQSSSVSK